MKKLFVYALVLLANFLFTGQSSAQDMIILTSGQIIWGYDVETTQDSVFFKNKPECKSCSTSSLDRELVSSIVKSKEDITKNVKDDHKTIKKSYGNFSFNIGLAAPLGMYASKDVEKTEAGLAKMGNMKSIRFSYVFEGSFGICALYKNHKNPTEVNGIEDYFEDEFPGNFTVEESSPYSINSIMLGITFPVYNDKDVTCDIDFLLGRSNTALSMLRIEQEYDGQTVSITTEDEESSSLALSAKCLLLVHLSERISLNLGCGYFTTKPTFEIDDSDDDYDQPIEELELSAGLGIRF